jgi:hypothetical protein
MKDEKPSGSSSRADVKPPKPPRDRKAERERRLARLAATEVAAAVILPEGSIRRRNPPKELDVVVEEISIPPISQSTRTTRANKNKTAVAEEPVRQENQQVDVVNAAISSNGNNRKRKRNEYESSAPILAVVDAANNQTPSKHTATRQVMSESSKRARTGTPKPSTATAEPEKEAEQSTSKAAGPRTTRKSAAAELTADEKRIIKRDKERQRRERRGQ